MKISSLLEEAMKPVYEDGLVEHDELTERARMSGGYRIGTKRKRADGRIWVKVGPNEWKPESEARGSKASSGGGSQPAKTADEAIEAQDKPLTPGRQWIDHVPGFPKQTIDKYRRDDGTYDPERAELHKKVVDDFVGKAKPVPPDQKPIALFMMGITASGKSTTRKKIASPFGDYGAVEVDPDAIKETIPEYQEGLRQSAKDSAFMAHEESSDIAGEVGKQAVEQRKNVVFDGTGKNLANMKERIAAAKAAGYHVMAIMPHVKTETAKARADDRAEKTGRYVPHEIIEGAAAKVPGNFLKLAEEFDEFQLFDNDDGNPKVMYSKKAGESAKVENEDLFRSFRKDAGLNEWLTSLLAGHTLSRGGRIMEKKEMTAKEKKKLSADTTKIFDAWKEGTKEADAEMKKLPKKFKKGEGLKTPLAD